MGRLNTRANVNGTLLTLVLLLIYIGLRLLFIPFPFWGLEYEDSYIFNVTGRLLNSSYDHNYISYLTQCCIDGSIDDCNKHATYGGHFLAFPYTLSIVNKFVGYSHYNIFSLNLFFSISIAFVAISYGKNHSTKDYFSVNSFLFILISTPFLSVFHTSGLSETFSSLIVLISLFSLFELEKNGYKSNSIKYWVALISVMLSIVIKRENLVLLVFLYSLPFLGLLYQKKLFDINRIVFIITVTCVSLLFIYTADIFQIESNESIDIASNTFSISYFIRNIKQLSFAFTNIYYWGITSILLIVAILCIVVNRKVSMFSAMAFILTILYIVLYSSHYRSYFQVKFGIESPFETLRYSTNYAPLIAVFISSIKMNNSHFIKIAKYAILPLLILSIYISIRCRINFNNIEKVNRINIVEKTLSKIDINDIIITDLPILFYSYSDPKQKIIAYSHLSEERFKYLTSTGVEIYWLKKINTKYIDDRVGFFGKLKLPFFNSIIFESNNYKLVKYNPNDKTESKR